MSFFFVTIGAAAGSFSAVLHTGWLTPFIGLQLGMHLAITVGCGKLLKLPMQVFSPLLLHPTSELAGACLARIGVNGRRLLDLLCRFLWRCLERAHLADRVASHDPPPPLANMCAAI
jgi:hypothetical protein